MGIYDSFEQYLPEMKNVRAKYDLYLKENNLIKTAEEKLFDYFSLISTAYHFNKEKKTIEFTKPNIADALQKSDNGTLMYDVISSISQRMRYREMQDKAEFSSFVMNEIYEDKENVERDYVGEWIYKRFPAHDEHSNGEGVDLVRYALNVKPGIGLFKKLDSLCLKYNALDYKIIDKEQYNKRTDPIIIYASKNNQKEMLEELENMIRPYRRKDEYEMAGYENLGNGIYMADEVKGETMKQLKYAILEKEETEVFMHPLEDHMEQIRRESQVNRQIRQDEEHPVKAAFFKWVKSHQYDYAVSAAQYQTAKMVVEAYNKTKENSLNRDYAKQIIR